MQLTNSPISNLLSKEWIDTNGLGGYASSSITGANTRKYHGLLVAAYNPPTERKVLVAKVEEKILQNGAYHEISTNQYPGTLHPKGYEFLKCFERKPLATWSYEGPGWSLKKKVFMVPDSNTTVVIYENTGTQGISLELNPLLEHKDYHWTFHENDYDFYYEKGNSFLKIHPFYDSQPFYISWSKGEFNENRAWYKNVELYKEEFRGQGHREDYYSIGNISNTVGPGKKMSLILTTDSGMVGKKCFHLEKRALSKIRSLQDDKIEDVFYNDLLVSGDQFLVNRNSTLSKSIIAGYHWFTDWGRDTMIAMRGLTIATGKKKTSKSILETFLKYVDKGMLPNRFPDYKGQEVEYNTIDATLWLFIALYEYQIKFGDRKFIQDHLKTLEEILLYHIEGTRYNIHLTDEGFISGGEEAWQLTWMDAKVDDYVVTPRIGCPVEINALWYNAMCIYEHFCDGCSLRIHKEISKARKNFKQNFEKYFLSDKGYLYDVVNLNGQTEDCFRPNQIYAVSLPFSILTQAQEKRIVDLVQAHLLTPYGLRTLNSEDPQFIGKYGGNQWDRDKAYHQGTVWPFLLMEYWEAYLKVNDYSMTAKRNVLVSTMPLQNHFYQADCIHGISEIFDGKDPDEGRGCINQAWSVAALLKVYSEHQLYHLKE